MPSVVDNLGTFVKLWLTFLTVRFSAAMSSGLGGGVAGHQLGAIFFRIKNAFGMVNVDSVVFKSKKSVVVQRQTLVADSVRL